MGTPRICCEPPVYISSTLLESTALVSRSLLMNTFKNESWDRVCMSSCLRLWRGSRQLSRRLESDQSSVPAKLGNPREVGINPSTVPVLAVVFGAVGPGSWCFSFRRPLNQTSAETWAPGRKRQVKRPRSRRTGVSL